MTYASGPTAFLCRQSTSSIARVSSPAPANCASGAPVCGCDGQTYGSDCARLAAGITKARDGACDPPAQACGNGIDVACPAGTFCDFSANRDCGESSTGLCRAMRAEPCNLCMAFVSGPVCGCDLVTYTDDCAVAAAGVSKWFNGPCP